MAAPPATRPVVAWLLAVGVTLTVVALDQATKALVRASLRLGERHDLVLGTDLVHVHNRGIAFGLFAGGGPVLVVLTYAALGLLLVYFARHASQRLLWLPTGLLLGGAFGNLIDRARLGAVTDFVDPPWWPAFNLADAAITLGVLSLLVALDLGRQEGG
jgi:signal peptidase II